MSTSVSSAASHLPAGTPRIKLTHSGAAKAGAPNSRPMTGKHPPGRPPASSKTRPTSHAQSANGSPGGGGLTPLKPAERRRAAAAAAQKSSPSSAAGAAGADGIRGKSKQSGVAEDAESEAAAARSAALKKLPPLPYVRSTAYVLKKFKGHRPSLIIHLHQLNFRFEGQDGSFTYSSPMRAILECIKTETIPHEVVEELREANVQFYDGCLIVQVHDHRTSSSSSASRGTNGSKRIPGSIHNYNEWICPSPLVPYPTEKLLFWRQNQQAKQEPADNGESEEKKEPKKTKVFTTVLHPTPMTLYADMSILATTPRPIRVNLAQTPTPRTPSALSINANAQTPTSPRPPKQKMIIDDSNAAMFEAENLIATSPALVLTPARSPKHAHKILQALKDPNHCFPLPPPKARKRTIAELQADEAQAAEQERLLLFMDERRYAAHVSGSGGPDSAVGDGAGQTIDQAFKKFKTLDAIKMRIAERKRKNEFHEKEKKSKEAERINRQKQVQAAQAAQQQQQAAAAAAAQQQQQQQAQAQAQAAAAAAHQAQAAAARAASQAGSPIISQGPIAAPIPVPASSAPMANGHHPSTSLPNAPTPRPPSTAPSPAMGGMSPAQAQALQMHRIQQQHALAQSPRMLPQQHPQQPHPQQQQPQQQQLRPQPDAAAQAAYHAQMQARLRMQGAFAGSQQPPNQGQPHPGQQQQPPQVPPNNPYFQQQYMMQQRQLQMMIAQQAHMAGRGMGPQMVANEMKAAAMMGRGMQMGRGGPMMMQQQPGQMGGQPMQQNHQGMGGYPGGYVQMNMGRGMGR